MPDFIADNKIHVAILIGAVALLVVADSEPGVSSIIQDKAILLPSDVSVATALIAVACLYIFFGIVGMWAASRLDLPVWWRSRDSEKFSKKALIIALGVVIVVLNMVVNVGSVVQMAGHPDVVESSHWISITPRTAVALSLHAAVTEEILFRLFFFSAAWTASHFLRSKKDALITGAVISCFLFGLMDPGVPWFLFAFVLGFPMIYIYSRRGLIPVMVIHFLADSIPFVIISVIL